MPEPIRWTPHHILVATDFVPGLAEYIARLRPDLAIRSLAMREISSDDVAWAQAYVGFRRPPVGEWGNIRWIHCIGAGVDAFLFRHRLPEGMLLTRSPEDFGPAIGEWCVSRALAVNQHLSELAEDQQAHRWDRRHGPKDPIMLRGQRVLVTGTGQVGRGIAQAFGGLGAIVHGLSRSGRPSDGFAQVHRTDDFIAAVTDATWLVLAAPLTEATYHWLDRERLAQCRGAFLLNVGRGALVDEQALPEALERGWITGAALDVFETEPLPPDSPLWDHPKVIVSPHISGPSTVRATGDGFVECLSAVEQGEHSRWEVDQSRGY